MSRFFSLWRIVDKKFQSNMKHHYLRKFGDVLEIQPKLEKGHC